MSVQLVAPHSVATKAMKKISVRSCRALLARGSGSSSKHSANRVIGRSIRIKSYLQNQFLTASQKLTKSHMRFPCPPGEGKKERRGAQQRTNHYPPKGAHHEDQCLRSLQRQLRGRVQVLREGG